MDHGAITTNAHQTSRLTAVLAKEVLKRQHYRRTSTDTPVQYNMQDNTHTPSGERPTEFLDKASDASMEKI